MNVLVTQQGQRTALSLPALLAGTVALENDDAISGSCRHEGSTVGEASPGAIGVKGKVAQGESQGAEQEGDVARKPGKLQSAATGGQWIWRGRAVGVDEPLLTSAAAPRGVPVAIY